MLIASIFSTNEYRRANIRIALIWMLACALLLAAIWGAVAFKIRGDQALLIHQAEREAGVRAKAFAEQVLRSVAQIDQLSMSIKYQREHRPGTLDLEDQFRRGVYQNGIYPVLIDAKGYAISSTRNLARGAYMGDLEFFSINRDQPQSQLHILPPAPGRGGFSGKQIIRFSRRIDNSDGSFDGAVLIAVEPEYIAGFHDASLMMPGDFISVRFVGGALLASIGGKTATEAFYLSAPLFDGEEGTRDEAAEFFVDKQSRLVGWQVLDGYPLVSIAALSKANVLKPYASTQHTYQVMVAVFSVLLIGVCFAGALNQIRNAARKRHAAKVQATFRLAVDGAREGFYMLSPSYGDDGALDAMYIEDCNERAAELSGYARPELIGKYCNELFKEEERAALKYFFQRVQEEKFVEDEFFVPEGQRHVAGNHGKD